MEARRAEREAARTAAAAVSRRPQNGEEHQDKEDDDQMSPKEASKIVKWNNPRAKFVLTREMELRHLMYSERHVGEVLAIPERVSNQLASLGMFNQHQGFQYMRRPVCVMRHNTGLVARELFAQDVSALGTRDRRVIVTGKGGNGKSFILLQMATLALMQDYVVIAVPRGASIVLGCGADERDGFS